MIDLLDASGSPGSNPYLISHAGHDHSKIGITTIGQPSHKQALTSAGCRQLMSLARLAVCEPRQAAGHPTYYVNPGTTEARAKHNKPNIEHTP